MFEGVSKSLLYFLLFSFFSIVLFRFSSPFYFLFHFIFLSYFLYFFFSSLFSFHSFINSFIQSLLFRTSLLFFSSQLYPSFLFGGTRVKRNGLGNKHGMEERFAFLSICASEVYFRMSWLSSYEARGVCHWNPQHTFQRFVDFISFTIMSMRWWILNASLQNLFFLALTQRG